MARRAPAFAWNPDSCRILNVFHGIHFLEEVDDDTVRLLVRWLNRNAKGFEGGRVYHGGLRKFEPSELAAVRVPPLKRLREFVEV